MQTLSGIAMPVDEKRNVASGYRRRSRSAWFVSAVFSFLFAAEFRNSSNMLFSQASASGCTVVRVILVAVTDGRMKPTRRSAAIRVYSGISGEFYGLYQ